ncbi:MAG: hypothetical protein AAGI17_11465 [Planctomycetota bacterium]
MARRPRKLLWFAVGLIALGLGAVIFETMKSYGVFDRLVAGSAALTARDKFVRALRESWWGAGLLGIGLTLALAARTRSGR